MKKVLFILFFSLLITTPVFALEMTPGADNEGKPITPDTNQSVDVEIGSLATEEEDSASSSSSAEATEDEETAQESEDIETTDSSLNDYSGIYLRAEETIRLDGHYQSDVYVAAQNISISDRTIIEGDLIAGASTITVQGTVKGDVRLGAGVINLEKATIEKSATLFAGDIFIDENSTIKKDTLAFTQTLTHNGTIEGNLNYGAPKTLGEESTGTIVGNTIFYDDDTKQEKDQSWFAFFNLLWFMIQIFGLLIVGIVLIYLFKDKLLDISETMFKEANRSLIYGLLFAFATPLMVILLLFTVIGLPLALITTVFYVLFWYLSTILVGVALGQKILANQKDPFWPMVLGTFVFAVLKAIPIIGGFIGFAGGLWAVGALIVNWKNNK